MAETPAPTPEGATTTTPFHQNEVDPSTITDNYPPEQNQNLERESNYAKPEDINRLVDEVLSGQFEYNMRNQRYQEIYGKDMANGFCLKAWLAGEGRLQRDEENGGYQMVGGDFIRIEGTDQNDPNPFNNPNPDQNSQEYEVHLQYNRANEIARRGVSVGIKLARQVGITVALSTITGGGIGAAFYWATGGATIGRGIVEGVRIAGQEEIKTREKIEIAKIRYFKKARELASRVGKPYSIETAEEKTENDYNMERSAAIMDLVNFVYSYENLAVDVQYDDRGRPYTETEVRGTPLPERTGPEATQDPRQGINRGPAYNRGTEVYQPSPVAPDVERVRDLEDKLAETSKKWDKRVELGGLIGGLAGVGAGILRSSSEWVQNAYNEFQTRLKNGEIVKLDIDGDWKRHGVQKLSEKVGKMQDRFVYHMRNVGEHLHTLRQGAEVLNPDTLEPMQEVAGQTIDKLGVHTLGETASRINAAVLVESGKHILYKVLQNVAAVGLNTFWERRNEICRVKQVEGHRDKFVKNQEQLRRRHQPAEVLDILKNRAETEHKVFPQEGQTWLQLLPDNKYHRIKILQVLKDGDAIVQHYDEDEDKNLMKTDRLTLQDIMDNYNLLTIREEAEKVPPQKPDTPPASPKQPSPPAGPDTQPSPDGGDTPKPDAPDGSGGGTGAEKKSDEQKKQDEEKKKEEEKKGPKVTIKTEQEAAKEIELKNGQVLIITTKFAGGLVMINYLEVVIDKDSGAITTKEFLPDPDLNKYNYTKKDTPYQNVNEFQKFLNNKDVKSGGKNINKFMDLFKKKDKKKK